MLISSGEPQCEPFKPCHARSVLKHFVFPLPQNNSALCILEDRHNLCRDDAGILHWYASICQWGLDSMISKGPFQPLQFCDSLPNWSQSSQIPCDESRTLLMTFNAKLITPKDDVSTSLVTAFWGLSPYHDNSAASPHVSLLPLELSVAGFAL